MVESAAFVAISARTDAFEIGELQAIVVAISAVREALPTRMIHPAWQAVYDEFEEALELKVEAIDDP